MYKYLKLLLAVALFQLFFSCGQESTTANDNQPPQISSSPDTLVHPEQHYIYDIIASDPDNDPLTIEASYPGWMMFSSDSRNIQGTPSISDTGIYLIDIQVSDGKNVATQAFDLEVALVPNTAPQFISLPPSTVDHNREFLYNVIATDADGDSLMFGAAHPSWLSFDPMTATLTGIAERNNVGYHSVTLSVTDGEAAVNQSFSIQVVIGEIICDTEFGDPDTSNYVLPYPVGKTYEVIQSNCHPFGGHKLTFAYDFDTQIGDTIVASRAGVVIFTNDQYEDGDIVSGHENNVFIRHEDQTVIRYTHLMQHGVLVSVGDSIAAGQPIGLSGNSGNTGNVPHLHLALFRDNTDYGRKNTLPVNFRNSEGSLDSNHALIEGQSYTALPY